MDPGRVQWWWYGIDTHHDARNCENGTGWQSTGGHEHSITFQDYDGKALKRLSWCYRHLEGHNYTVIFLLQVLRQATEEEWIILEGK